MGVFLAAQNAMNQLWGVPFSRRPNALLARGRALLLLLVLGGGALSTTLLAGLTTVGAQFGLSWKLASLALSTALNIVLFWLGFRLLTARDVSWRQLRGGAIAAGVLYEALQALGGYYVGHTLKHASDLYGTFGLVIGLLSWIYLTAHIALLAAEANVVASRRLWPRSFSPVLEQPATRADKRALTQLGKTEERRQDETITVDFPTRHGASPRVAGAGSIVPASSCRTRSSSRVWASSSARLAPRRARISRTRTRPRACSSRSSTSCSRIASSMCARAVMPLPPVPRWWIPQAVSFSGCRTRIGRGEDRGAEREHAERPEGDPEAMGCGRRDRLGRGVMARVDRRDRRHACEADGTADLARGVDEP